MEEKAGLGLNVGSGIGMERIFLEMDETDRQKSIFNKFKHKKIEEIYKGSRFKMNDNKQHKTLYPFSMIRSLFKNTKKYT